MSRRRSLAYYLIYSAVGAILLLYVSIQGPQREGNLTSSDRLFVGGLFIFSCLFGISLAFRPNWIHRISSQKSSIPKNKSVNGISNRRRRGHHPLCARFQNHTITYNGRTLCAGCLGLAIGCVLAIFLTTVYLYIFPFLSLTTFVLSISIGLIVISFSYIEAVLPQRTAIGHVVSNIFLVTGLFLVVAGVFGATESALIGTFAVILSFLWLDTRAQLSGWNHAKICRECKRTCQAY